MGDRRILTEVRGRICSVRMRFNPRSIAIDAHLTRAMMSGNDVYLIY